MNEFIEKLIGRLEEQKSDLTTWAEDKAFEIGIQTAISIVNQLAEEYGKDNNVTTNGWITDRIPTKEECGEYGNREFQVTIPQPSGNKTITMDFVYETVRGKEVARWKWCGRLPIWEVLAWKPLDEPYQPKGE